MIDREGHWAASELSPLEGWSVESLREATAALDCWLPFLRQSALPSSWDSLFTFFDQMEELFSPLPSSVRCAIESSLMQLVASREEQSLSKWLYGGEARELLPHAVLLPHTEKRSLSFEVSQTALYIKKKCRPSIEEIAQITALCKELSVQQKLILDANRSCSLSFFCKLFAQSRVRKKVLFVEEPLASPDDFPLFFQKTKVHYGLDESLREERQLSQDLLSPRQGAAALIVKPTLSGGRALFNWSKLAQKWDLSIYVSAAYESSVQLILLLHLAALLPNLLAVGLDTVRAFSPSSFPLAFFWNSHSFSRLRAAQLFRSFVPQLLWNEAPSLSPLSSSSALF